MSYFVLRAVQKTPRMSLFFHLPQIHQIVHSSDYVIVYSTDLPIDGALGDHVQVD